jgi:nicotinate-nucleotide adenylyltransferase
MVEAAVGDVEGLEASDVEIRSGGVSYTADTLRTLLDERPDRELYLVLGADAAGGLPSWERVDEVRELSTVIAVERPGVLAATPLPGWRWEHVEVPSLEVSSTDLRDRVRTGRPLDYRVALEVVECIRARGLYLEDE